VVLLLAAKLGPDSTGARGGREEKGEEKREGKKNKVMAYPLGV